MIGQSTLRLIIISLKRVSNGMLSVFHVASDKQLADLLTKGPNAGHFHTVCKLGMRDIYAPA